MSWTIEQNSRNVTTVRVRYQGKLDQRFLLTADRHWDNPHSDRKLQRRHLEQATGYDAGIIDLGDFFCAMQGKYDKRADKSSVRREHQRCDYLDSLVETADGWFAAWAQSFILIGEGNHEASILKRHEVNLTDRLCYAMRRRGSRVVSGGYSGWVRFRFEQISHTGKKHRAHVGGINLHYSHGYGGGGPVTRDVIQTNRRAVYLPDADIVVSGHTHDAWSLPIARLRITQAGEQYHDEQLHVKLPTYKQDYGDGYGGWHVTTGKPPKPLGAYWLRFYTETRGNVEFEVLRASKAEMATVSEESE